MATTISYTGHMALEKKYDATPLQVLTDKVTRARIVRLKNHTGRSQAQICRDILEFALPRMEELWGINDNDE
jgi:predicted DNA-binding protein